MSIKKLYIYCISFFCCNLFAINGFVNIGQTQTEKDWDFMPTISNSFKSSETSYVDVLIYSENFGLKISSSDFFLALERPAHPKKLDLSAQSNNIEIIYLFDNQYKNFSVNFGEQLSDDQFIDCYTFLTITIGSCDEARINISSDKEKYNQLDENIIMISGENKSVRLNYNSIKNNLIFYELNIFLEFVENNFDWLSPVEEITLNKESFTYNLNFSGKKLGDIVDQTLSILPQRNKWNSIILGASTSSYINLYESFYFFLVPTIVFVEQDDYSQISNIPRYNFKLRAGVVFADKNIEIALFGEYFKNNLYGFEHISFNQRSEHHFNDNFGSLGIELKYLF